MTSTPATISAMPSSAQASSFSPKTIQPTDAISTMPSPDQVAYTTPTGMARSVSASSQNDTP